MESGIGDNDANLASHLANTNNPHKVTAAQVGLGNVQNFGLATEDEAKQGISKAKYMTPSLTQAVLSANINSIAYANSADGTDGFTIVYPNLNLLTDSKDFKNKNVAESAATTSITSPYSQLLKEGNDTYLRFTPVDTGVRDWFRAYMIRGNSVSPNFPNVDVKPNTQYTFSVWLKGTGTHQIIAYDKWTNPNPTTLTVNLTDAWTKYVLTVNTSTTIPTSGAQFFIRSSTVGSEINLKYPKVEPGSTATPYMPSSSEVTTADWPKYIGFSNTVKTNKSASDYTWFPVKDSELTNKVDSHVNNKANPHAVTASQVGAYSKQEIDTKLSKAVMADDSGKVSIGTLDSNTLTVQGTKIYPNTKDGVWTVERLFDNEYRLTTVMSVSEAVSYAWNSLFISSPITHTAIPSGYIEQSFTSSMANTSSLMWCAPDTNTSFRIVSGEKSQGASRKVIVTVYATK